MTEQIKKLNEILLSENLSVIQITNLLEKIIKAFPQITKKPVYLHLVDDGKFSDSGCHLKLYKPFYCSGDAKEWAKDYFAEVINE
ncbi:hypothetical protein [Polynucleobacter sp.]|uniref:hypothetical protein n=1 Tax=Polynucleobacter sp. TaxID=2029855 RepID=UPI003F695227